MVLVAFVGNACDSHRGRNVFPLELASYGTFCRHIIAGMSPFNFFGDHSVYRSIYYNDLHGGIHRLVSRTAAGMPERDPFFGDRYEFCGSNKTYGINFLRDLGIVSVLWIAGTVQMEDDDAMVFDRRLISAVGKLTVVHLRISWNRQSLLPIPK